MLAYHRRGLLAFLSLLLAFLLVGIAVAEEGEEPHHPIRSLRPVYVRCEGEVSIDYVSPYTLDKLRLFIEKNKKLTKEPLDGDDILSFQEKSYHLTKSLRDEFFTLLLTDKRVQEELPGAFKLLSGKDEYAHLCRQTDPGKPFYAEVTLSVLCLGAEVFFYHESVRGKNTPVKKSPYGIRNEGMA